MCVSLFLQKKICSMESENRFCLLTCLSPTLIMPVKSQNWSLLSSVHAGIQMSHNTKLCSPCGVWEGPITGPLNLGSGGRERWQPTFIEHGEPESFTLSFTLITTPWGRVLLLSQFMGEKSESRDTVYLLKHRQLLNSVWGLRLTEATLLNCSDIKCKLKMVASTDETLFSDKCFKGGLL